MIGLRRLLDSFASLDTHRATHRLISSFKGQPQQFVSEINGEKAALVYFYTAWCEPCRRITEKLEAIASPPEHDGKSSFDPEIALKSAREACLSATKGSFPRIIPVDADENPKLTALHDVRSLPTFVAYREGRIVGRVEGSGDDEIQSLVSKLTSDGGAPTDGTDPTKAVR